MHLLYLMDPLCGWCYGFSPVLKQLAAAHPDWTIDVLPGGMVTGQRVGPVSTQMASYITESSKRVGELSGVVFGEAFLASLHDPEHIMDSEPGARALLTVRHLWHESVLEASGLIQECYYQDGADLSDPAVYGPIVASLGHTPEAFYADYYSEAAKNRTQEVFGIASQFAQAYPTLVQLHEDNTATLVAQGYLPYEALIERLGQPVL
jgi:putative protein-disulfide isomerase